MVLETKKLMEEGSGRAASSTKVKIQTSILALVRIEKWAGRGGPEA